MTVIAWDGESKRDKDDWSGLFVVWTGVEIWKCERTPYPVKLPSQTFAIGSGRAVALAARRLGKTAQQAAEVACVFDSGCGNGVDILTYHEGMPA